MLLWGYGEVCVWESSASGRAQARFFFEGEIMSNDSWQRLSLTENFTLGELCRSSSRPDLVERPSFAVLYWLRWFAKRCLQPLRDAAMVALAITSGFRPPALNKAVGGVDHSIHQIFLAGKFLGVAADLKSPTMHCDALVRLIAARPDIPITGVIVYPHEDRIHIDTRPGRRAFFVCRIVAGKKIYPPMTEEQAKQYQLSWPS